MRFLIFVAAGFLGAIGPLRLEAKPIVLFTSPCTCEGNHGVSRWAAKTDLAEPATNHTDIKPITPSQIYAWHGPGEPIGHRSGRIASENQWYAATGRMEKVRIEDDGDVHIELGNVDGQRGRMVVELPLGPRWCEMRRMIFSWTNAHFPLSPGKADKFTVTQHPIVTVIGKAFYDIDHSGNDTSGNRRNYDASLAIWEIHPVMNMAVGTITPPPATVAVSPTPVMSAPPISTPVPQPTNTPEQFVTILYPVTVRIPYGTTVIPRGMKLVVISRGANTVRVQYLGEAYDLPASATAATSR